MPGKILQASVLVLLWLSGCNRFPSSSPPQGVRQGKYTGVGIYGPGKQWTRLTSARQNSDRKLAELVDDQVIIVVQDSATGEVRACGDLTGYCIGMNPWKTTLMSSQIAPVKLTEHRAPDTPDATVELEARRAKPAKPSGDGDNKSHAS